MSRYSDSKRARVREKVRSDRVRKDWRDLYHNNNLTPLDSDKARIERSLTRAQEDLMKIPLMREALSKSASRQKDNNKRSVQFIKMANRRMLMSCLEPMSQDLSPTSFVTSLTMFAAAYCLNKRLRDSINLGFNKIQEHRYAKIIERVKTNPEEFGDEDKINKLYKKWEKYASATHDGRVPLNPESAASLKIALEKERYDMTRSLKDQGFDKLTLQEKLNDLDDRYMDNIEFLKDLVHADSLDWSDVQREERIIVDRLLRFDTTGAYTFLFDGLSQGDIIKSPPQRRKFCYERDGQMVEDTMDVWDGQYYNTTTKKPHTDGFQARPLYDVDVFSDALSDLYVVSCADAKAFDESGKASSFIDSQAMMYQALSDYLDAQGMPDKSVSIELPEAAFQDEQLAAMRNYYMDYFAMAKDDRMTADEVIRSVGLATSQGLATWITSECIGEDYATDHDDIADIMQAKQFAMASDHLSPDSSEWQAMATSYFGKIYSTDALEADPPELLRELWQERFTDIESRMHDAKSSIISLQSDLSSSKQQLEQQFGIKIDTSEFEGVKFKNNVNVKLNPEDTPESIKQRMYSMRDTLYESQSILKSLHHEKAKEASTFDQTMAHAVRVWNDKEGYAEAAKHMVARRDTVMNMSKVFTEGLRTAKTMGASDIEADASLNRGVATSVNVWANGDDNNVAYANAVNYIASSQIEEFMEDMRKKHGDWFVSQSVKDAEQHVDDVVEQVYNRYQDDVQQNKVQKQLNLALSELNLNENVVEALEINDALNPI